MHQVLCWRSTRLGRMSYYLVHSMKGVQRVSSRHGTVA